MHARRARASSSQPQQQPAVPVPASSSAAKEIAGAGASAVVEVYHSLRAAASSVSTDVADATVDAVTHRYGEQAGISTRDGLQAFDNIGRAAFNLGQMTASAFDEWGGQTSQVTYQRGTSPPMLGLCFISAHLHLLRTTLTLLVLEP